MDINLLAVKHIIIKNFMRTISHKYILLFFAIAISGCQLDDKKNKLQTASINQRSYKEFVISNSNDTVVNLEDSLRLLIKAGAFIKSIDYSSFDSIVIKYSGYNKLSEMIMKELSTMSDTQLLKTNGMFFIDVIDKKTKNKIREIKDSSLVLYCEKMNCYEWSLFYGDTTNKRLNWLLPLISLDQMPQPFIEDFYKETGFYLKNIGWLNFDQFIQIKGKKDKIIIRKQEFDEEKYFIIMKNYKCIVYAKDSIGIAKFEFMPIGEPATIIAKGVENNQLSYAMHDFIIGETLPYLDLKQVTSDDYQRIVEEKFD